jgi:hypothetical protein
MENARQLQCKALRRREKSRRRRNNGEQWKNNPQGNGNSRKSEACTKNIARRQGAPGANRSH